MPPLSSIAKAAFFLLAGASSSGGPGGTSAFDDILTIIVSVTVEVRGTGKVVKIRAVVLIAVLIEQYSPHYFKIPVYPMFYLLRGDYILNPQP